MSQIREVRFKDTEVTVSYISAVFHSHLLSSPLSSFFISLSAVFLVPNFILCFLLMALTLLYIFSLLIIHLFVSLFELFTHFPSLSVFLCVPLIRFSSIPLLAPSCFYFQSFIYVSVGFYLLYYPPWSSLPPSLPCSASVSSPLLDICRAQQNACGCLTHNPLVWRLVAVFIIIPNRCLITLQHPPKSPHPHQFLFSLPPLICPLQCQAPHPAF